MSVEIESRFIKHGLWTNLDQGPIMGKTITTDTRTGNLVVALLALLSTLGTAHLWHLVTFLIHQVRANGRPSDALFRQQQALLRTLPPASSVMADTLKLWWTWRRRASRPFLRSLVLVAVALFFTLATIAASIFSSLVVDTTNLIVLVQSADCGWESIIRMYSNAYVFPVKAASAPYARQCYRTPLANETLPAVCNVFVQRVIPFATYNASCPFDDGLCQEGVEGVKFDTGLVDVGKTFGLNMLSKDKVQFRKKTTCSILAHERPWIRGVSYSVMEDGSPADRNSSTTPRSFLYQFGTRFLGGSENTTLGLDLDKAIQLQEYTLRTFYNYSDPNAPVAPNFSPIPQLKRENNTLVLIFIGLNAVSYNSPVNDPLFNATVPMPATFVNGKGEPQTLDVYLSSEGGRFIGCQEQYQFCYARQANDDYCTFLDELPLSTYLGALPEPENIDFSMFPGANAIQKQILRLLVTSSYEFNMATVPLDLLAGSLENPDKEAGLPDDQWIRELTRWQKEVMASLQVAVADYAIGPENRDTAAGVHVRPSNDAERQLCGLQKMRKSGNVVNINVFGLAFIISLSCFVALLDIGLLKFLIYLSKFRRALAPRIDRWIQDGVWQLQRRAYEGEGHRNWTELESEIPLMDKGQKLKDLPILWLPGKSPAVMYSDTFATTNTFGSQHPLWRNDTTQNAAPTNNGVKRGFGWLKIFRR